MDSYERLIKGAAAKAVRNFKKKEERKRIRAIAKKVARERKNA